MINRQDFPFLATQFEGREITYLDSAALSLKPYTVLRAEQHVSTRLVGNVHRSVSAIGDEITFEFEAARHTIANYVGSDSSSIIFTPNTTFSIQMVASGSSWTSERPILCAFGNHHSNLLPWMRVSKVIFLEDDPLKGLTVEETIKAIKLHNPQMLAFTWVSNINGAISPVKEICHAARELGVITLVDAAQAAPHVRIDVEALGADFICFSGHKMLGPTGTGVLWGRRELLEALEPLVIGGGSVANVTSEGYQLKQIPQRLESGTPNISGIIGFAKAIEYLTSQTSIWEHGRILVACMRELFNDTDDLICLKPPEDSNVPILTIVPKSSHITPELLCRILSDKHNIMIRAGYQCAHPYFDRNNLHGGGIRISAYLYNTVAELEYAACAISDIFGEFS